MSAPSPRLAVIVFTRDDRDPLSDCLARLAPLVAPLRLQVIVYDNASRDDTLDVCRRAGFVEVLAGDPEVGFSTGNNRGLARVRAPVTLFLNPDTLPHRPALEAVLDCFDGATDVGLAAVPLVYPDGRAQPSAFDLPGPRHPRGGPPRGFPPPAPGQRRAVGWVLGAFVAGPTDFLRELGGFDESFWFCGTDVELCARVHRSGRQVMLLGAPPVVHVGNERWTGERRARVWASRLRLTWRDRGRTAAEVERAALLALALARVAVHGRGPAAGWRSLAGAMVGPLGAVVSREGPGGRSGETLRRG